MDMKCVILLLLTFYMGASSLANNVRVVGDVSPSNPKDGIVDINFTIEWENSWRDSYNYDAVYVVLKYRRRTQSPEVWYPIYLQNKAHSVDRGFTWSVASGTVADRNVGLFIYRDTPGSGISRTNVKLKWDFSQTAVNGEGELTASHFFGGNVIIACVGVEMVYIPKGTFALGDMSDKGDRAPSSRTFRDHDLHISEEDDVVSTKYLCTTNGVVEGHGPELAVNHVNDICNTTSNAWVGNGDETQSWRIEFQYLADSTPIISNSRREIRYIGIESIPGHVPKKWKLSGAAEDKPGGWHPLYEGTDKDWGTSLERTYPPTSAIRLTRTGSYKYYQIVIDQEDMPAGGKPPIIKSVAMTEKDLLNDLDYTFMVDSEEISLGGIRGLAADKDGEDWPIGVLPASYPNGYGAFYVMKYEISQEQYVKFLQLLPPEGQRARTIGADLDQLNDFEYVFGGNRTQPSARNGIVLSSRNQTKDTASFACNLNLEDGGIGADKDGMSLGCNYLSAADMLAYASWLGLRPMSELEYERMSRPAYPYIPSPNEGAWGESPIYAPPVGLLDEGKNSERFSSGNANYGNTLVGPTRVGSFASSGAKRIESGASFWGVMDLSGNLNEIYYSANAEGRKFNGSLSINHGNGILPPSGIANIAGWNIHPTAFTVRGGSFATTEISELNTSYRRLATGYFKSIDTRDSTMSFRLGRTVPEGPKLESILTFENGQISENGTISDTICAGADYQIIGNEPVGKLSVTYIWYKSENQGRTWELMQSEYGKDISLYDLENKGREHNILREYWFKRKVIRDESDGMSHVVKLKVIDDSYSISRNIDTIDGYGTGAGILVETKCRTSFQWKYINTGKELLADKVETLSNGDTISSFYIPKQFDFSLENGKEPHGTKIILVEIDMMNTCKRTESISVQMFDSFQDKFKVKNFGDYRAWADDRYARSAEDYIRPAENTHFSYSGDIGSGIYRIDPDGRMGPVEPFDVYCDMEKDGGGWSVVKIVFTEDSANSGTEADILIYSNIEYDLTEEQIIALKAVSKEGSQFFRKKCYHSQISSDAVCRWTSYGGGLGHYYDWPNYRVCNNNDAIWRESAGEIKVLNLIPIQKYWGDETGNAGEFAKYTFGDTYFK